MKKILMYLLMMIATFIYSGSNMSAYSGSQAYNNGEHLQASVNVATGTFHFSYPVISTTGIHHPFKINLTYSFNATGILGLPQGWRLSIDHVNKRTLEMGGQWLIDPLWNDETLYASGLKYFNQHGSKFKDKMVEDNIPGENSLTSRYKMMHKEGMVKYFSGLGLLVLQKDRFGNQVVFEYEEPVSRIEKARLSKIRDNYGNVYSFSYEPGAMTIHYPDAREFKIYYNEKGVVTIINPMKQKYEISYIEFSEIHSKRLHLLETIKTPLGLNTELSYKTIPIKVKHGRSALPVVSNFKQLDSTSNKVHHESYYSYSDENNYTGYPLYSFTNTKDSLMESNDEDFRYTVKVESVDNSSKVEQIHQLVYEFNYLHLPTNIRTFKDGKQFLKTENSYNISPFKYAQSVNYDKPKSTTHSIWSAKEGKHIPSKRVEHSYDLFGNKTQESHWIYHRPHKKWRQIQEINHKYHTNHYSLLAESSYKDMISGKAVKAEYQLAPSKKTHISKKVYGLEHGKVNLWKPWQQEIFCYDKQGRLTASELSWIAKGMPGIQKTKHKVHYLFDKQTGILTIKHESSLGNTTQKLMDTRNGWLTAHITAMGEKTEYRYNKLGQMIEKTDPEGHIFKIHHYTYAEDGLNAKVMESPLGFKQRHTMNAANKLKTLEEYVGGKYQLVDHYEYNAFGKVISRKDSLGHITSYQYDDQFRLTATTDNWNNKTQHIYDDDDLTTHILINNQKHIEIKKTPWTLTLKKIHYPSKKSGKADSIAIVNTSQRNGFNQLIREENALLNLTQVKNKKNKHSAITRTYEYDIGKNKTRIDTVGYDGISISTQMTYDLFRNMYTLVKEQNNNGKINTHTGYSYVYNSDNQLERSVSPALKKHGSLITQHHYDKNGREIERILPNGRTITKKYTPCGHLKSLHWHSKNKPYQVNHDYNADGRLIKISDSDNQEQHYEYDTLGNITRITYPDKKEQTYGYDKISRIIHQKNMSNRIITYEYDEKSKGLPSAIKSGDHQINLKYGEDNNGIKGRLLTIERKISGKRTVENYSYGPFGRVNHNRVSNEAGKTLFSRSSEFSPRGELIKQTTESLTGEQHSTISTVSYDYDSMTRLTKEKHQRKENKKTIDTAHHEINYEYDANNNLVKEQRTVSTKPTQTILNFYNKADQLITVKTENPVKEMSIVHDKNGRIVVDHNGNQYHYNDFGELLSVSDAKSKSLVKFYYFPDGYLRRSESNKDTHNFYYHNNGQAQTVIKNQQSSDYIQTGGKFLSVLRDKGGEQLFIANQSTDPRLVINKKGEQDLKFYRYEGYGQSNTLHDNDADFLWNQEFMEKQTGLVYLRSRFYHPQLRRFITRDELNVDNRYAYALANPVKNIDPSGHSVGGIINYIIGGFFALAGGAGIIASAVFAVPISIAASAATMISGLSMIAAQIAADAGSKSTAKIMRIVDFAMAGVGGLSMVAGIAAPLVESADSIVTSVSESIASTSENTVSEAAKTSTVFETSAQANAIDGETLNFSSALTHPTTEENVVSELGQNNMSDLDNTEFSHSMQENGASVGNNSTAANEVVSQPPGSSSNGVVLDNTIKTPDLTKASPYEQDPPKVSKLKSILKQRRTRWRPRSSKKVSWNRMMNVRQAASMYQATQAYEYLDLEVELKATSKFSIFKRFWLWHKMQALRPR